MDLRNHPAVCFNRTRSWPPVWINVAEGKHRRTIRGELGTLCTAYMMKDFRPICYVTIEHQSETFVGAIMLDDFLFCKQVCLFLNQKLGQPIATIGGLPM
jgi:hypothetical protein